jgi:hypothetical protein
VAFLSVIIACFVFAHGFASIGEGGWARFASITGVTTPILIVLGFAITSAMGLLFVAAGAMAMIWVSTVCWIAIRRLASTKCGGAIT